MQERAGAVARGVLSGLWGGDHPQQAAPHPQQNVGVGLPGQSSTSPSWREIHHSLVTTVWFIDLTSLRMCACHVSWCRIVSDGGVSRCLHHQVKLSQRDRILDRQIGHYEDPFEVLLPVGLHTIVRIAVVLLLLLLLRCYRCLLYILANPEARGWDGAAPGRLLGRSMETGRRLHFLARLATAQH